LRDWRSGWGTINGREKKVGVRLIKNAASNKGGGKTEGGHLNRRRSVHEKNVKWYRDVGLYLKRSGQYKGGQVKNTVGGWRCYDEEMEELRGVQHKSSTAGGGRCSGGRSSSGGGE